MKFGHQLEETLVSAWAEHYVDYKAMKKLIKQLLAEVPRKTPPEQAREFTTLLERQLDSVNAFYAYEEAGLMAKWRAVDLSRLNSLPSSDVRMCRAWLKNRILGSQTPPAEKTYSAAVLPLSLFCDVYDVAQRLRQYTAINFVAFVKGMKKFEKKTGHSVSSGFMPRLQRSKFFLSANLPVLITEMDFATKTLLPALGLSSHKYNQELPSCGLCGTPFGPAQRAVMLACGHQLCWDCMATSSAVSSADGEWACPHCKRPQFLTPLIHSAEAPLKDLVESLTRAADIIDASEVNAASQAQPQPHSYQQRPPPPPPPPRPHVTAMAIPNSPGTAPPGGVGFGDSAHQAVSGHNATHWPNHEAHDHHHDVGAGISWIPWSAEALDTTPMGVPTCHSQRGAPGMGAGTGLVRAPPPPPMPPGPPAGPPVSVISETKEQEYYGDLVALADQDVLPAWPLDLDDLDLLPTTMSEDGGSDDGLPGQRMEFHDVGAAHHRGVPAARAHRERWAVGGGGAAQAAAAAAMMPWSSGGGGGSAGGLHSPPHMTMPGMPPHSYALNGGSHPAGPIGNIFGGAPQQGDRAQTAVRQRAKAAPEKRRPPRARLDPEERKKRRMLAQREYRQRISRGTEMGLELKKLHEALQVEKQALIDMSRKIGMAMCWHVLQGKQLVQGSPAVVSPGSAADAAPASVPAADAGRQTRADGDATPMKIPDKDNRTATEGDTKIVKTPSQDTPVPTATAQLVNSSG
jgi:hypothetical protein